MKNIDELRDQIDETDSKILELLNKRANLALQVKQTRSGKTPIRPEREKSLIRNLTSKNQGPLPKNAVQEIYIQIIASFRDHLQLDRPVSVSYLGPPGTYSEEAAVKMFGATIDLQPENTIHDVIRSVEAGTTKLAVVPIENSSEGAVRETHKLLQDTKVNIVAEATLPIVHCLLSKEEDMDKINIVYGHSQAISQCRGWLAEHLPKARQTPCSSNSIAAKQASKTPSSAAIASLKAAEKYDLKVIKRGINDHPDNETRFVALGDLETRPTGKDKTTVVLILNDKPGALYEILGVLADAGISMTRLESQPVKKGQYAFYIDFIGHVEDAKVRKCLEVIKGKTKSCRVLGSYLMEEVK